MNSKEEAGLFVKFCASSAAGFLLDNTVFTAIILVLKLPRRYDILIALVVARVISALFNYLFNRRYVFGDATSVGGSLTRYALLAFGIATLSYALTATISAVFDKVGLAITLVKVAVEIVLFLISYIVQRRWVF